ncbi:MAG TPA: hypothetical protein VLL54_02505 [Pyrinomonadaceae bacterium]|nr:hypothetical protein [Pyrinomonadaceae bacterium]
MVKNRGKHDAQGSHKGAESKNKLDDDLDALFSLPLAEFTAARNVLAKQLKQSGRGNEADFVKSLGKPSVSAWAVNQLFLNERAAFDRLIAAGDRFRLAQTSRTRNVADMRSSLDARRDELAKLSDLAAEFLRDTGHNPTPDILHRITTTLEGISASASLDDAPRPGRLTHDVDPPGFESFASLIPSAGITGKQPARNAFQQKSAPVVSNTQRKTEPAAERRQLEDKRRADRAAVKASLQEAKSLLSATRTRAQSLEAAQKKANAEAKEAELQTRDAEKSFKEAKAASEAAAQLARSIALEVKEAAKTAHDAQSNVEKITKELELMFREPLKRG